MRANHFAKFLTAMAAAALGATLATPLANAQTRTAKDEGVYVFGKPVGRSPTTGAPIQWVSYSIIVHTNDLDLRSDQGVNVLNRRIKRASHAACSRLDILHPVTADGSPNCFRATYAQGMQDAGAVIAAARSRP